MITLSTTRDLSLTDILQLYHANQWSSANKPQKLYKALLNSHSLITAWDESMLVGLGNAISDGHYFPVPSHSTRNV